MYSLLDRFQIRETAIQAYHSMDWKQMMEVDGKTMPPRERESIK
jgi:hypothetical protein